MLVSHTFTQSARNPGFPLSSHRVPWVQPAVHSGSRPPLSTRPRVSTGSSVWRRREGQTAVMGSHRPLRFSDFEMSLITRPTGLPHWGRTTPSSNYDTWVTSCLWPFQEGGSSAMVPLGLEDRTLGVLCPCPPHIWWLPERVPADSTAAHHPLETQVPTEPGAPGTRCTGCWACADVGPDACERG